MEFLIGVINAVKKGSKAINLGKRAASGAQKNIGILLEFFKGYLKGLAAYIIIIVLVIAIVVGGVRSVFDYSVSKGGDNYSLSKIAASISSKEAEELIKDGSSLNPQKLTQYGKTEDSSYPKSATVKMHTIDDGRDIVSDYNLDLTKTSYQFRTPWQLVAGIDVAKDIFTDASDLSVVNSASTSLIPQFQWGYDKYTKDVTDSRKEYVIETTQDKNKDGALIGKPTEIKNTKDQARQIDVTKKFPLPFPDTVSTPLKKYTYHYALDKTTKDDPWSSPIIMGTPRHWDETVQDGTEDDLSKPIYGNDYSSPIYGNDYSSPISSSVEYNTFRILNMSGNGGTFDIEATTNGFYSFTGNEWYQYAYSDGDYYIFDDYSSGGNSIRIPQYYVSTSDTVVFEGNTTHRQNTGDYEQKITGYGQKVIGYEQKPKYKTVHHVETNYKIVKQKIVEDQISYVDEEISPQPIISFVDQIGISRTDLALVHDLLENMPNAADITDDLQKVIDGNYLNSGMYSGAVGGALSGADLSSEIPLFIQWDERWGNIAYGGSGTIATSGCGPTSAAMVITGLSGNLTGLDRNGDGILDPSESAAYSVANGFRIDNQGTSWGFFSNIGAKAGLKVRQYTPSDYQTVLQELQAGHPVIASMTPGVFTRGGHFIVLTGVAPDGKIRVNDPNSPDKSKQTWDFNSIIVAQAAQFWAFENPNMVSEAFQMTVYGGQRDAMEGILGITADGTDVRGYRDFTPRIIATDPKVIPTGSIVYIQFPADVRYQKTADGKDWDMNGWYTARDTGGAIKGTHIDLFMGYGDYAKAMINKIGTRQVKIMKRQKAGN